MEDLLKKIKTDIITKNKKVVLILLHGSGARNELKPYSDIDVEVFVKGRCPLDTLFFKEVGNKKRFVGIKFKNFEKTLIEVKDSKNWIWHDYDTKVKVLYDKGSFFKKLLKNIKKPNKKDLLNEIPETFWYKIEEVSKIKNAYLSKDNLSIIGQARCLAYGCYEIISIFNKQKKITKPSEEFERFFKLKDKPKHFEKDFKICTEFDLNKKDINKIYDSSKRMIVELIYFLRQKPEIKKVNSSWFKDILFNDEIIEFLEK